MLNIFNHVFRVTIVGVLPTGLLLLTLPQSPASANQFDDCIRQITSSGISGEKAASACSDALIPRELSQCVSQIKRNLDLPPDVVLQNCYQVRRPVDLGNCVVDINNQILKATKADSEKSLPLMALTSCQQSLLPGRYSECVIATSRQPDKLTPSEAMQTCLSAEDFPRDLFPEYTN